MATGHGAFLRHLPSCRDSRSQQRPIGERVRLFDLAGRLPL